MWPPTTLEIESLVQNSVHEIIVAKCHYIIILAPRLRPIFKSHVIFLRKGWMQVSSPYILDGKRMVKVWVTAV